MTGSFDKAASLEEVSLIPILLDALELMPAHSIARLQLASSRIRSSTEKLRSRVLSRRGLPDYWSWQKAHAVEAALFVDPLGDPGVWIPGPNYKDNTPCNTMESDADHDQSAPWLWLSGGTDWQGFQGGFRVVSDEGIRPTWVSFRVKVSTPELSGAFLTLSSQRHTWGLADPVLVFSYKGDETSQKRCFAVQTGATQNGDVSHTCNISPEVVCDSPYEVAVYLDWSSSVMSVFIDGTQHVDRVPFKGFHPIRFAAIYNWRSRARTAFSELLLGHDCPFEWAPKQLPAAARASSAGNARCSSRCRSGAKRLSSTRFLHLAFYGGSAALLAAVAAQQLLSTFSDSASHI
mmetsp:Transcript_82930/g.130752  ORF Transcript_82930/g.130752 Transcript_82930/m.130752 type:complete len:348 (-) Transcript_82930:90-1133(-)